MTVMSQEMVMKNSFTAKNMTKENKNKNKTKQMNESKWNWKQMNEADTSSSPTLKHTYPQNWGGAFVCFVLKNA